MALDIELHRDEQVQQEHEPGPSVPPNSQNSAPRTVGTGTDVLDT